MRSRLARRGLARTLVWSWFDWRGGVLGMMVLVCVVIRHFGTSVQDTPLSYNWRGKITIGLWAESPAHFIIPPLFIGMSALIIDMCPSPASKSASLNRRIR